jgi:hypothetical protein
MTLRTIFENRVDRTIEGVIKADDQTGIKTEIEEYVLTNEIEKRLESFFEAYNHYKGANGVWISGFFGSGKSHLLKILALLLENREIEGTKTSDLIISKCNEKNGILKAQINQASKIPSKSILFNIDQKADVISKKETDALLSVFVKVFDEFCGYFGKQPYIAQFERELDHDGLFEKFKNRFKEISTHEWEWARMRAKRFPSDIDTAYSDITGHDVTDIIDKYRSDYSLSIEDFADQVQTYIKSREKDFRLNFFVDEVGQYVADNVKLMTNLQTIAESLATKSKGQAWIIVTAQEEMSAVVGEMNKQQGNDFSKIQARFDNRMKLTSTDVAEVIQKRLLLKNEEGKQILSKVYKEQSNNFKTLFDFGDGSQHYKNFRDLEHFINSYPFIPYQFFLFQTAIQNLSIHNAFEGKHSSVGERSMLGVFQQVTLKIADNKTGKLATFDLMFEGIRSVLKSQIQSSVHKAEKNLDNNFAVKVLKALFLVKYIKEFKATKRNLMVLMLDEFNKDIKHLKLELTNALDLLETQTYIQRNGEIYEFLTDDEKDIEESIKNTEIETAEIEKLVDSIIFDGIIKFKKIRYTQNQQDYQFTRKIDGKLFSRQYELSINIITSSEYIDNEKTVTMQSFQKDELLVFSPFGKKLYDDILMHEKVKKYYRINYSKAGQESVKRIIAEKFAGNTKRYENIKKEIETRISSSNMYIDMNLVSTGKADAQTRIVNGFNELVTRTYPNLKMLPDFAYSEAYVTEIFKKKNTAFFENEAANEILSFILTSKKTGQRNTIKSILDHFGKKNYGWYYSSVLCLLAHLCAFGKVELNLNGNILDGEKVEKSILNSHSHPNIIVEPVDDYTASQLRNLKEFFQEFFERPSGASEPKKLGAETALEFENKALSLKKILSEKDKYPFLKELEPHIQKFEDLSNKTYKYFFTDFEKIKDELFDLKEDFIDPVQSFMAGSQKKIYDESREFLKEEKHNISYLELSETKEMEEILNSKSCFKSANIQRLKLLKESADKKILSKIEEERQKAQTKIISIFDKTALMDEFKNLSKENTQIIKDLFDKELESIKQISIIGLISGSADKFENEKYTDILNKIIRLSKPLVSPETENKNLDLKTKTFTASGKINENKTPQFNDSPGEKKEIIGIKKIEVSFKKVWIEHESELEEYIGLLKEAVLKELKKGKKVQI